MINIAEQASLFDLSKFRVIEKEDRIKYEFQELGQEMQKWFPKKEWNFMWSLFYKYRISDIRQAWNKIQRTDVHSIRYLIGIIKKLP